MEIHSKSHINLSIFFLITVVGFEANLANTMETTFGIKDENNGSLFSCDGHGGEGCRRVVAEDAKLEFLPMDWETCPFPSFYGRYITGRAFQPRQAVPCPPGRPYGACLPRAGRVKESCVNIYKRNC